MKAAVYHGARDVRVEEAQAPDGPQGPHDVLLETKWCGICGTDLHEYAAGPIVIPAESHPLTGARLPQILGHEFSADVLAVGPQVTNVRVGDRVSVMPLLYCGECYYCRRGQNHLCTRMACVGLSWAWGGLGRLAVVRDYNVAPLPDELSYEQGALVEPAAVAAWGVEGGGVRPGHVVLVAGGGPIGCLAVLAAFSAGAARVFVSEPNPRRRTLCGALGASEVFDPTSADLASEIQERTEGLGADVCLECAGNQGALNACLEACRPQGTVVQTGLHVRPAEIDPFILARKEVALVGTWCYPVQGWPRLFSQVASGRFPIEKVVTRKIPLNEIVPQGFQALLDPAGADIKVLVNTEC